MQPRPPAVIALQEVGIRPSMQSYDTHGKAVNNNNEWRVATLVHKSITAIQHKPIEGIEIPHIITEILYKEKKKKSIFILNIYSPPRQRKATFDKLFEDSAKLAKQNTLIVVGDFNAKNPSWGFLTQDAKGRNIAQQIEITGMTLLTDPAMPTRLGNSNSRDTTPDLTMCKNCQEVEWHNTLENLGSDHYILCTTIHTGQIRKRLALPKY
uniref:Putative tick transposon n=1 Tax=Rhipicephalus microplus TaxID=6941 RepID=A0A6G5A9U2_RHIMP